MATIGTFKKTGTEYTGEIFTLSLQAKGVRLVPDLRASGENAPSHRVLVGRAEIGAAWTKKSNEGREYLGLKLDDPSFAARRGLQPDLVPPQHPPRRLTAKAKAPVERPGPRLQPKITVSAPAGAPRLGRDTRPSAMLLCSLHHWREPSWLRRQVPHSAREQVP